MRIVQRIGQTANSLIGRIPYHQSHPTFETRDCGSVQASFFRIHGIDNSNRKQYSKKQPSLDIS